MESCHPFRSILHSLVLRNKIFKCVKDIHSYLAHQSDTHIYRCDWYDLGCFPHLLIKFNYIDRFKLIFNTIVRDSPLLSLYDDDNSCNHDKSRFNEFLEDTIESFKRLYLQSLGYAIKHGHLQALEFIHNSPLRGEINYLSILYHHYIKHLKVVEFLHRNADNWLSEDGMWAMDVAAEMGCLDVVKFLHENRTEGCSRTAMDRAAMNGHLEVVAFLNENRTERCSKDLPEKVSYFGHLPVIEYLLANTTCSKRGNIDGAASRGNFHLVKYLHDNHQSGAISALCSTDAMDRSHCLEITKFLHENRTEGCTDRAMYNAAIAGCLDIVKFLHENRTEGCLEETLDEVAAEGHFEIFKFLCQNRTDLTYSSSVVDEFCRYKDTSAMQWFKENTTLKMTANAFEYALYSNNLDSIKWLRYNTTHAYPSNLLDKACSLSECDISIVKYLDAHGATATTEAMDNSNNMEIISFLHSNRTEGCTSDAMFSAIRNENLPKIKFLLQNRTEHLGVDYSILLTCKTYAYQDRIELIKHLNI